MAFSLNDVQQGVKRMPRKIIIYGPPKLGKSTLAGSTKNVLLIPTEDRVAHIDCPKTPVVKSYHEVMDIFNTLLTEKHSYKRIVIDTLDWFEPLVHEEVCIKKGWDVKKGLTDDYNKETSFQKGLKYHAVEGWKKFLHNCDVLRDNGMDVILIAHSHTIKVDPPMSDSYDKYVMKIDKNALSVVEEWADIISFYDKQIFVKTDEKSLAKKGKAISAHNRKLYLSGESPAMLCGNSFGLPDVNVILSECSKIMEWLLTGPYKEKEVKKEAPKTTKKGDK